jgi:hypothetical protein
MPDVTVPVSEATHRKLRELADRSGRPAAAELERAVEDYYNRQFWAAVDAGYAALRADPQAWAAEQAERRAWDATLADGLDPTERWADDGTPLPPAGSGQAS